MHETFGCGRMFSVHEALPYLQSRCYIEDDQYVLRRLTEDLAQKEISFNVCIININQCSVGTNYR